LIKKICLATGTILIILLIITSVGAFPAATDPAHTFDRDYKGTFLLAEDMDGDGKAEIILNTVDWPTKEDRFIVNYTNGFVYIRKWDAGSTTQLGSFGSSEGNGVYGIAIGNFDDTVGKDIATTKGTDPARVRIYAAPQWNRLITEFLVPDDVITAISSGDINKDGYDDIVLATARRSTRPVNMSNASCEYTCTSDYSDCMILAGENASKKQLCEDNKTACLGECDYIIQKAILTTPTVRICNNWGLSTFTCDKTRTLVGDNEPIFALAVGDVGSVGADGSIRNADTRDDIIAVSRKGIAYVFYQLDSADIAQVGGTGYVRLTQVNMNESTDVAIGDINNDGNNDIVIANSRGNKAGGAVAAYYKVPYSGFLTGESNIWEDGVAKPMGIASGDLGGTGNDDIIIANSEGTPSLYIIDGQHYGLTGLGTSIYDVAVGDLDGDSTGDIIVTSFTGKTGIYLQENVKPVISNMSITPISAPVDTEITFTATASDADGVIENYEWNSSKAGTLYSGASSTFSLSNLSEGTHTITLRVKDSGGMWSTTKSELLAITSIAGALPSLGINVQIVPRYASVNKEIYAFNVDIPAKPCPVLQEEALMGDCTNDADETSCEGLASYKYAGIFPHSGDYDFQFHQAGLAVTESISVGVIGVEIDLDADNLLLEATLTEDVIAGDDSWVKYQLYEAEDCKITPIGSIKGMSLEAPGQYKKYYRYMDNPTCKKETCTYMIEVLARSGATVGGNTITFEYLQEAGNESIMLSSDALNYFIGQVATIYAVPTGLGSSPEVTYNVVAPSGYTPSSGSLSYDSTLRKHKALLPIIGSGDYTVEVTAKSRTESWKTTTGSISFKGLSSAQATLSDSSIDFGKLRKQDIARKDITITNPGDAAITNLEITLPAELITAGLTTELSNTTAQPGGTVILSVRIVVSLLATIQQYSGAITISGTGLADLVLPVTFLVEGAAIEEENVTEEPGISVEGSVSPASWGLGSVAPGSTTSKGFALALIPADAAKEGVTVTAMSSKEAVLTLDKMYIDLATEEEPTVMVEFVAPTVQGEYSESIDFTFIKDGTPLSSITVPITFTVKEDVSGIIDDVDDKRSQLVRELGELEAQMVTNKKLAEASSTSVARAKENLGEASTFIAQASEAAEKGDIEAAKSYASQANDKLENVQTMIMQLDSAVSVKKEETDLNILPIIIGVAVLGALGGLILALREGWLDVPAITGVFEKIGLGGLVKKASKPAQKMRFTDGPPTAAPAQKPATPAQATQMNAYYKQNPAYAKTLQQQQTRSYYNRRYK